jgi:prevent-host-death family protein
MPSESVSHFNIRDARAHLSRIIARVEQGEEIIICRAGQPVVKLIPLPCTVSRQGLGSLRGKLTIA